MKVVWETRKIFGLTEEQCKISCTAVRIPIMRAHSEAITIETEKPITADAARYDGNSFNLFLGIQDAGDN